VRVTPLATTVQRPALLTRLLGQATLLSGLISSSAVAQIQHPVDPNTFPDASVFRAIQLKAMACGRENTPESCQQARAMADPLMDHPKLPAPCKDSLWGIVEQATVAPNNSYARREALNRDATEVTTRCRAASKPLATSGQPLSKGEPKPSGGGLGGFLRGLGIGGNQPN